MTLKEEEKEKEKASFPPRYERARVYMCAGWLAPPAPREGTFTLTRDANENESARPAREESGRRLK
jgi:hypothetical protein